MRWLARCAVCLAFLGAAFVAVGYRYGPERYWLLAFIQYLPYPLHLAPALTAVMLSFALGRAWRLGALVALGIVVRAVMGLELHWGEPADGRMPLRVMTYNIKASLAAARPDGFARLAREIATHSPDIVVVQDAGEPTALQPLGRGRVAALFGSRHRYAFGQFVMASRYPLRGCAPGEAWIRCTVDVGGTEVDLYAVHLRTPREGLDATRREALGGVDDWQQNVAERMAQAADLARRIRAGTRPAIVGGDLNAPETSLVVRRLLQAGLRDAWSTAGFGYGYTYGHAMRFGFSFLRIDHVLASSQIGVADCHVGGSIASEHRPVIADLLIPKR